MCYSIFNFCFVFGLDMSNIFLCKSYYNHCIISLGIQHDAFLLVVYPFLDATTMTFV